jgi:glutamyl-tRNA synthetase
LFLSISFRNFAEIFRKMKVVTRIAPSPTGLLHCGTLRTALYNYLFAKQNDGIFYLRIEDTDQKRFVEGAEDYIKRSFEWAGFEPDYAPWKPGTGQFEKMRQSERDYSHHINYLLDNGLAYYAFDTEEELAAARSQDPHFAYNYAKRQSLRNSISLSSDEVTSLIASGSPYVIRFKTPQSKEIVFNDMIRGEVCFNSDTMDDKVLVKSNGIPTYHLASVCDDHDMETTHVIRGEEWLPSTPLHIMLYEAFGWTAPEFAHLPTILRPDGRGKISKRDALKYDLPIFPFGGEAEDDKGNLVKYKGFNDTGFEADAILNFLLLLGWAPSDDREIFSMSEMIQHFSLERVHKAGARFDIKKAEWLNAHYLQTRDFSQLVNSLNIDTTPYSQDKLIQIVELAKSRSTFKSDIEKVAAIFDTSFEITPQVSSDNFSVVMSKFLDTATSWEDSVALKQEMNDCCVALGVKPGKIMPELRKALCAGLPGPDLFITMSVLGKTQTNKRIKKFIQN